MKRFLALILLAAGLAVYAGAEAYTASFEKVGDDVDYLVFYNETDSDLVIRYFFLTTCSTCMVKKGDKVKIKVGIDAGRKAAVKVAVTFEAKSVQGEPKELTWSMDGKHNDINIHLEDGMGWTF